MRFAGLAISMGVGLAAGTVAAMLLPKDCTVRKAAQRAATAVEDAATTAKQKIDDKLDAM